MVEACGGSDEGAAAAHETARRAAALREQEAAEKDVEEEVLWCTSRSMSRTALHAALATRSLLAEALFRLNPPLLHLALRAPRDLSPAAGSPRRLMPKLVSRDLGRRLAKLLELLRPEKVMNVPGAAIVPPASQVLGWNGDPNSTGTPAPASCLRRAPSSSAARATVPTARTATRRRRSARGASTPTKRAAASSGLAASSATQSRWLAMRMRRSRRRRTACATRRRLRRCRRRCSGGCSTSTISATRCAQRESSPA